MTIVRQLLGIPRDVAVFAEAAECLRGGGLVAFPTETVYGLGALALEEKAVARIFAAKGRPAADPLIIHIHEQAQVTELVTDFPPLAELLAAEFWPGPLTLVLPKSEAVPAIVTAGGPTVALRVPSDERARSLLLAVAAPLAAPSANRFGRISPTRAEHVLAELRGRIEMLLDGGPDRLWSGIDGAGCDDDACPNPAAGRPHARGIAPRRPAYPDGGRGWWGGMGRYYALARAVADPLCAAGGIVAGFWAAGARAAGSRVRRAARGRTKASVGCMWRRTLGWPRARMNLSCWVARKMPRRAPAACITRCESWTIAPSPSSLRANCRSEAWAEPSMTACAAPLAAAPALTKRPQPHPATLTP